MPEISRRVLLGSVAATVAAQTQHRSPLRIGITDWNLLLSAQPDAVSKAQQLGFKGVQISFGRRLVNGKLPLDSPEIIREYLNLSRQTGITIDGTCVDRLHDNGLVSDPLAPRWVSDAIRLTRDLQTKVLLLPFFGRWAIRSSADMEHVGMSLRDLAPEAEKAGVILGLEDTVSAEDNVRIMDLSRSHNVLVYYDVGNSTVGGFDVVKEIRWLGKDRICQFHFKDNPHFLGEGSIRFKPILEAIRKINWSGWANLETDARPGHVDADLRRNLGYIRQVISTVYA